MNACWYLSVSRESEEEVENIVHGKCIEQRLQFNLSLPSISSERRQLPCKVITHVIDHKRQPTQVKNCYFPPTYNGGRKVIICYFPPTYNGGRKVIICYFPPTYNGGRKVIICVAYFSKVCQISTMFIHFT